MNCKTLLDIISTAAQSDLRLAGLYGKAEEYVQVYLFAKRRQRGCDGLGEVANLKDELHVAFEEMIAYCREREYLDRTALYDVDLIIEAIGNI